MRRSCRSPLARRAGSPHQAQVLCANLDLAVLVLSTEPNFSEARNSAEPQSCSQMLGESEGMVDRVLVSAHAQGLEVVIVLNKAHYL